MDSTQTRKFNSVKQVQKYAEQTKKCLLIYEDNILDVTSFASHHPGGAYLLKNNHLKNIQQEMKFHYPMTVNMANTMAIGSFKKDISRIMNPDQPLLTQIWKLTHQQYMHVIHSPVWLFVDSPKMFETDWVDKFSHCNWYVVPLMPIIIITYMYLQIQSWQNMNVKDTFIASITGLIFFTFIEYTLHRFIFHSDKFLPDSRVARYIHFFAHGIHHMLPNDPQRLVLPPPFYSVIITIGYYTVGKIITFEDPIFSFFFWSFFQIGYAIYDLCHYALHHIDTSKTKGGYFHRLQQYHNQHHFSGQQAGFGVSSMLWDIIFRTGYKQDKKKL